MAAFQEKLAPPTPLGSAPMTRFVIASVTAFALLVSTNDPTPAQGNSHLILSLDTSINTGDCRVPGDFVQLFSLYVLHYWNGHDARSVRYRVVNCGTDVVFAGERSDFAGITGDALSGIAVDYGDCRPSGTVLVQAISFFTMGNSPDNTGIMLTAHPESTTGSPEAVTCDGSAVATWRSVVCVNQTNPNVCQCGILGYEDNIPCETVPVRERSWSRIKSLYN